MENESRKRLRSDESTEVYSTQIKIFVNPQIAIKSDKKEMDKVHDKTISLLFKGAKSVLEPENSPVKTKINGSGAIEVPKKADNKDAKEGKKNNCCLKPAKFQVHCGNCGLDVCEFCGFSCASGCSQFLCRNCIVLFDCGTLEEPKCENCKLYV